MSTGREIVVAFVKGTTWGTAVDADAALAGSLVIDPGDFKESPEMLPDDSAGFEFREYIDTGNVNVIPAPNMYLRADGSFLRMLAYASGQDTATQVGATADYDHVMIPTSNPNLFGTYVLNDGVSSIREIPSYKPTGWTISGSSGQMYTISFTGRGDKVTYTGGTTTATSSATLKTKTLRFPFGSTRLRINDASAGALGSGDQVNPISLELNFQRDSVPDFVGQGVAEGNGENYTDEPAENNVPILTGSFGLPEFTSSNNQLLTDLKNEVNKKIDILVQGALTGEAGAQRYDFAVELPAIRITNVDTVIQNGQRIPVNVEFEGMKAQSIPTAMNSTDMYRIRIRNQTTTDYDA